MDAQIHTRNHTVYLFIVNSFQFNIYFKDSNRLNLEKKKKTLYTIFVFRPDANKNVFDNTSG